MTDISLPPSISGTCDARFATIPAILAEQLESGAHHGVSVAVRHRGEPVVDVWGGAFEADSMAISFSTTKGPAAVALHMVLERKGVGYDTPVAEIWPEFGRNGKDAITIRQCLCHEAGVPQIRGEIPDVTDMADWDAMVAMMESLSPLWGPGTANGYHALNYGWLVGELVRRIDGRTISQFIAEEVAGPLGLDGFYIGTPESEHRRIAPVFSDFPPEVVAQVETMIAQNSIAWNALSPAGDMNAFLNSPAGMSTCGPAFTGAFTARSLAALYAAMERGGSLDGKRLLKEDTVVTATTVQNKRPDLVLVMPIHWRLGFMSGGSSLSPAGPNPEAYGHAGWGGSIAMADPKAEIAVAVVLDRLELDLLGGDRTRRVIQAAVAAVESA